MKGPAAVKPFVTAVISADETSVCSIFIWRGASFCISNILYLLFIDTAVDVPCCFLSIIYWFSLNLLTSHDAKLNHALPSSE